MSLTDEESKVTEWMRNDANKWLDTCFDADTERPRKVVTMCEIIDRLSARVEELEGALEELLDSCESDSCVLIINKAIACQALKGAKGDK